MRAGAALALIFALSLASGLTAGAALAAHAPPPWQGWQDGANRSQTYHVHGFTLTTSVRRAGDSATAVLTVAASGRRPVRVEGATGRFGAHASFLVFPAERPRGASVILFRSFTGGAHCCDDYRLIEPTRAGWRVRRIGAWDNNGPEPKDADGDGRLELVAGDQRFDYRLTSHAESVMPPVIFVVRDGGLAEVSADPRFRRFYASRLPGLRRACLEAASPVGPCLGYVAVAARAGHAKAALAVLDGKPGATAPAGWEVPERCGGSPAGCAHETPTRKFSSRHDAVVHFLRDLGYLRAGAG